jgi:oligopeptide/dipeptide ABC transporter ATP-binding protein
MKEDLLKVVGIRKWFPITKGVIGGLFGEVIAKQKYVRAVDGISFEVRKGEIFGLVGESGCGKTTLARVILRLTKPTDGKVYFENRDIFSLRGRKALLKFRREAQMVFQDPYASLNLKLTVQDLIFEPLKIHKITVNKVQDLENVEKALEMVGLHWTKDFMDKRPPQLSGGEKQRLALARVLLLHPKFLVLDEPVSMLDASLKSVILNLLVDIREKLGVTCILITHDLTTAWHMCQRMGILYLGKMVESGPVENIIKSPLHPYTKALISAVPTVDLLTKGYKIIDQTITGQVPTAIDPPKGCRFHPRCPRAMEICKREEPVFTETDENHMVACHLYT